MGKMQTANSELCLEIFSVFPAAARNQEGKKKQQKNQPKQEFTQPLQCHSFFRPSKAKCEL